MYLHLLSDPGELTDALFSDRNAIDEALQQLSCTSWETDSKMQLIVARASIMRCMGLVREADILLDRGSQQLQSNMENLLPATDELDSYEALVRDAGTFTMKQKIIVINANTFLSFNYRLLVEGN